MRPIDLCLLWREIKYLNTRARSRLITLSFLERRKVCAQNDLFTVQSFTISIPYQVGHSVRIGVRSDRPSERHHIINWRVEVGQTTSSTTAARSTKSMPPFPCNFNDFSTSSNAAFSSPSQASYSLVSSAMADHGDRRPLRQEEAGGGGTLPMRRTEID